MKRKVTTKKFALETVEQIENELGLDLPEPCRTNLVNLRRELLAMIANLEIIARKKAVDVDYADPALD